MSELFIAGLIAHLVADWFFQNDWQAVNKVNPKHPAGYIHAGIHTALMLLVFPPIVALVIGVTHWLIDLRVPLVAWRKVMRQAKDDNPLANHVRIWQDQVAHIVIVYIAALVVA